MNIRPVKILLIEDNPGDVELVRIGFEEARVANELEVISDGQEGLDFIRRKVNLPDVILLDINLPKVDGFEILKAIRAQEETKEIPVIILTSSEAEQDVLKSYQYAANSYVSKPVDFDKFLDAVKSLEQFWFSVVTLPPSTNN